MIVRVALILVALSSVATAETFEARWRRIMIRPPNPGMASWFTDRLGAWGHRLRPWGRDPEQFYCASPDEPVGTRLIVCSATACLVCRVLDKGPAAHLKRPIDLPPSAFEALGFRLADGLGPVTIDRD